MKLPNRQGLLLWAATVAAAALALPQPPRAGVALESSILEEVLFRLVVLLNGLAGLVLGLIYWRWGILAAIGCHFAGDVVVQTLAPRVLA